MSVILDYPIHSFVPQDVEAAIREHLQNSQKPVSRICRERKVSRATFYRWLPKVSSPDLSSEATNVPDLSSKDSYACPLCGAGFPKTATDRELLVHLDSCPKAGIDLKLDARKMIWEIDRCTSRSVQQSSISMTSALTQEITSEPLESLSVTETELMEETSGASDVSRINVKEFVWGEPEPPDDSALFYEKYSPVTGEVVDGWDFSKFCLDRMAGCRHTSNRNAHTTMNP